VFQAVECHRGGVILYDTGNFIDDHWNFWNFGIYWNFPFRHDDWSFVFLVDLEAGRPRRLRMLPVRTRPWPLSLATGTTFEAVTRRMEALSARARMPITRTSQGLEMAIA
jgi:poly-gamma-glutamate synthesis protein (capsule biosynthesis protein)